MISDSLRRMGGKFSMRYFCPDSTVWDLKVDWRKLTRNPMPIDLEGEKARGASVDL
jgi:hypothetical protein